MIKTSEYVSLGHPDKVADYISSYLLDRHVEIDPATRYAVEVQIKGRNVTLGGEVTSKAEFTDGEIAGFVRDAVNEIGYDAEYVRKWGEENAVCGDMLETAVHLTRQSPDIARGVNQDGWGDQGIFWGMATGDRGTGFMPEDWFLARKIGRRLYDGRVAGLDVKTQVTMDGSGLPHEIVVAVPTMGEHDVKAVMDVLESEFDCPERTYVNGTGRYVRHGPVADCGTTGRKLAVDFYGGNCRIGGGSPWTKDGSKADLTLNMYARKIAKDFFIENPGEFDEVHCAISCRIGWPDIIVSLFDGGMRQIDSYEERRSPRELISSFGLDRPVYASLCREGLLSGI